MKAIIEVEQGVVTRLADQQRRGVWSCLRGWECIPAFDAPEPISCTALKGRSPRHAPCPSGLKAKAGKEKETTRSRHATKKSDIILFPSLF